MPRPQPPLNHGFWHCQKCGTPNPWAIYLTDCMGCGTPMAPAVRHCTECGNELPGGAKFCANCGTRAG